MTEETVNYSYLVLTTNPSADDLAGYGDEFYVGPGLSELGSVVEDWVAKGFETLGGVSVSRDGEGGEVYYYQALERRPINRNAEIEQIRELLEEIDATLDEHSEHLKMLAEALVEVVKDREAHKSLLKMAINHRGDF